MEAVTSVAQGGAASLQPPVEPVGQNGPTSEQKLVDYVMRFQAEGLARAQHLANPAAISGEAVQALKGYLERASALYDSAARKARVMSESGDGLMTKGSNQLAVLPGGPARERLEPAVHASGEPVQKPENITDAELGQAVDVLVDVLRYSMETAMVSTATNNVSKSAMTLTRGQ